MSTISSTPPALPAIRLDRSGAGLQLALGTGMFAVCFAIFGSVSAMMTTLQEQLHLTTSQTFIALSIPVLLGSLGRIPLGILADRLGGKSVGIAVMLCSALAALAMGFVSSYWQLLTCGLFLGISLAVFSVGVTFVSGWYPPQKQGAALGVYGAGNIGQSLAAWGCPVLALWFSPSWGFWAFALLAAAWAILFALLGRNAPRTAPVKTLAEVLKPLSAAMSWVLSLFYFLTFGGFVAMALCLPKLLVEVHGLTKIDAGMRTAGFVVLATLLRPIGGALADKIGGTIILLFVFAATTFFAIFMACPSMITFTIGALGMAASIGLGNGAVFKLVPQYFPKSVGAVTGLVGAAGGLGGFFPPLVLGYVKQATGAYTLGFIFLALFSVICLVACWILKSRTSRTPA